jgi:peroxiredoxin
METRNNHNSDVADDPTWADAKLAALAPDEVWQPDPASGLVRLGARQRAARGACRSRVRPFRFVRLAAEIACIVVLVYVATRVLSPRIWPGSHLGIVDIGQVSADVKALKDGQPAPDFILKDSSGADIRLSSYKGRVVLLNFWATWCHGCKLEIPWIVEFQKKYKDRGFAVIGVAMDDDGWKSVKPFVAEKKLNYTVVVGNQEMAKPFGLDAMPMTFLIDRDGKIAATSVGIINREACERQIAELLGSARGTSGL